MKNFIHVSMYLADANWGHNIKNQITIEYLHLQYVLK